MDPNTALENILRGYMIADHADALRGWFAGHGFEPGCTLSVDCHEFFAAHVVTHYGTGTNPRSFKADRHGIWSHDEIRDEWILAADWRQILELEDAR